MAIRPSDMNNFVTALLPSLSQSLAEQFNIFRVMHHGTHEKQLSNVFVWLLDADATHEFGDKVQRAFLSRVNATRSVDSQLPLSGYHVVQEVDTRTQQEIADDSSMDIADIVLSRPEAAVVIENYGTSDGHGHDFHRYLAHGAAGGRSAAVVLLCHRYEAHLQREGWEQATVVTYAEILSDLQNYIDRDKNWSRRHPEQLFFIRQMMEHFVEGAAAVDIDDQISFIKAMCETGESARYGYRPRDRAAQEFAESVAEHARRQFDDSRSTLAAVKDGLRRYARTVLTDQVNESTELGRIQKVVTRFVGQWEWCVELQRADAQPTIFLEFGPTAAVENGRVDDPLDAPDYSRIFLTLQDARRDGIALIIETEVSLGEIIEGLSRDDVRLRDAVLAMTAEV